MSVWFTDAPCSLEVHAGRREGALALLWIAVRSGGPTGQYLFACGEGVGTLLDGVLTLQLAKKFALLQPGV